MSELAGHEKSAGKEAYETVHGLHSAYEIGHGLHSGLHGARHAVTGLYGAAMQAAGTPGLAPVAIGGAADMRAAAGGFMHGHHAAAGSALTASTGSQVLSGLGGLAGLAGIGMGGYNMYHGGHLMSDAYGRTGSVGGMLADSKGGQGALDIAAGGLGVLSGVGATAAAASAFGLGGATSAALAGSLACPPLAIAAGLAGLGAVGNEFAESHGWYGQRKNEETGKMENETFFGSIGNTYSDTKEALGGGVLGTIGGGIAGAGQTLWNSGAAVVGGVAQIGSSIGRGLSAIASW